MTPSGHYHIGGNNNDVNDADDNADSVDDDDAVGADDERLFWGNLSTGATSTPQVCMRNCRQLLQIYLSSFHDQYDYHDHDHDDDGDHDCFDVIT